MASRLASGGNVDIDLSRGRDVAFQLRDGDGPVAGLVERKVGQRAVVVTHADDEGQGVLAGLGLEADEVTAAFQQVSAKAVVSATSGSVVLRVPSSGVIAGRMIDHNGHPIPSATLSLIRSDAKAVHVSDTGAFRAEQLAGGTYTLEAAAAGFRFQTVEVNLEKRQRAQLTIRMIPGAQVTVQFVTAAGDPVPKPRLDVESNGAVGFEIIDVIRPRRTYSGTAEGRVDIRDLPLGVTQLILQTPPFARLRLPVIHIRDFSPEVDLGTIVVGEGATYAVTVKERAGDPRAGVNIQIDRGPGVSPLAPAVAVTDVEGHAALGRLGPGRYRVRVGGDDRPGGTGPFAEEWFTVSESDTLLERTFTVGGVTLHTTMATDAGPIASARVAVMPGSGDEQMQVEGMVVQTASRLINAPFNPGIRSVTDESGQATLRDVPPGPARLSVELPRSSWSMPIIVGITDTYATIIVPAATAELFVRDAISAEGIPARAVWKALGSDVRIKASADATGGVLFQGISDAPAILEFESREYVPVRLALSSLSSMPTEVFMDRVDQTNLTVQLLTADGRPVQGGSAELVQAAAKRWKRVAVSRDDGTVRFSSLEAGLGRLVVRHPSFATSAVELASKGSTTVRLVLSYGYRTLLRLSEQESSSRAPSRLQVSLLRQQGSGFEDASDDVYPRTATPGAEIELGILAAGTYRAVLSGADRNMRCEFVVRDSATVVECP